LLVAIACPISPLSHLRKPAGRLTVAGLDGHDPASARREASGITRSV
jgi:hypothetical protein